MWIVGCCKMCFEKKLLFCNRELGKDFFFIKMGLEMSVKEGSDY